MIKENIFATFHMLDKSIGIIDIGDKQNDKYKRTLSHAFIEAAGGHPEVIILNFNGLPTIDSVNLSLLIGWLTRTGQKDIHYLAYGLNHSLYEVFRLVGLDEYIAICASEKEAWSSLGLPMPPGTKPIQKQPKPITKGVWAEPVSILQVHGLPANAISLNVGGRKPSGPLTGFGRLWLKTYWVVLPETTYTPSQIVQRWRKEFTKYWPRGNYYFGPTDEITPGQVAVLHLAGLGGANYPGKLPFISTGVLVIYADEESFAFLSVEGHMIAGMISFTAFKDSQGFTVIQVKALGRPSDPLYELIFRLGLGHKMEDGFWTRSLRNLAICFGVPGKPETTIEYLDKRVVWSKANNLWKNAAVNSMLYTILTPVRWIGRLFKPYV